MGRGIVTKLEYYFCGKGEEENIMKNNEIYIGDDENDFIIYEEAKTYIDNYSEIIKKKI